ncbi:DMT family transporter [Adlercreutzia sp. ZJ138]|uniref:DMT family transporter n=1 Tax=Adlercreutzia sp. ZJ138 TaxID=2709405 RepID=UPI0013EDDBA8|nr:DMT family transporter [Adlercreutzia sp. ZJ138]
MSNVWYKLLIVAATIMWGLSFVFMKDAVNVLQPAYLIGIRFSLAGLILLAILWKHVRQSLDRRHLVAGLIVGVLNFLAFWVQTIGLAYTTPGKNAFITGVYCVIVPFAWWLVAKKRPTVFNLLAAVLAVAGLGLVSLTGSLFELTIEFGDLMTLVCAFFFAFHIVCVSKFSDAGLNVLALTVYQFLVGGVCGLAVGACTETLPPASAVNADLVTTMLYLVVCASCLALLFQNIALAHVPPAQASLLLSLESVFGVVFSVILYGEQMTPRLIAGFALIFAAIVISETFPLKKRSCAPNELESQS